MAPLPGGGGVRRCGPAPAAEDPPGARSFGSPERGGGRRARSMSRYGAVGGTRGTHGQGSPRRGSRGEARVGAMVAGGPRAGRFGGGRSGRGVRRGGHTAVGGGSPRVSVGGHTRVRGWGELLHRAVCVEAHGRQWGAPRRSVRVGWGGPR